MSMNRVMITDAPRDIMILFLKSYFSVHDTYTYSEDPSQRKILIVDEYALDVEDIEKLPSVIIQRGPINILGLGMADSTAEAFNFADWKQRSTYRMCSLNLRINVVAQDGLIAERLASECVEAIVLFKDTLKEHGFHKIDITSIGAEQPLEIQGTTITKSAVAIDLAAVYVIKLSMKMKPEYTTKITKIFLKSVEKWYETGSNIIEMEVERNGW